MKAAIVAWVSLVSFLPSLFATPLAVSTFDSDLEGWTVSGDGGGPYYSATGGNPGGCIYAVDKQQKVWWYFSAPAKFLGNKLPAYGQSLTFDLKPNAADPNDANVGDVVLEGAGLTLVYDYSQPIVNSWNSYSLPLKPSFWRRDTPNGTPATEEDLKSVLANLQSLRIRGEYKTGADTCWLDNVVLHGVPDAASTHFLFFLALASLLASRRCSV